MVQMPCRRLMLTPPLPKDDKKMGRSLASPLALANEMRLTQPAGDALSATTVLQFDKIQLPCFRMCEHHEE